MSARSLPAVVCLLCPASLSMLFADAPVPDGRQIKQNVLKSLKQSEKALENYSCLVHQQSEELNSNGSVSKHRSSTTEQFFVNGIEISHTLAKDGKDLAGNDAKKEQARVDKEVQKYSDRQTAERAQSHDEKQADMFLRALRLSKGRRTQIDGRNTLVYDLAGDPDFRPRKLEERFAEALIGRIWIDEETATLVELKLTTTHDLKIGGGLLVNLHKGFWLHIKQQRQPDGAWITKEVEGSGDARAALFVHARFRFREDLDKCHLFSVTTQERIENSSSPKPEDPAKP